MNRFHRNLTTIFYTLLLLAVSHTTAFSMSDTGDLLSQTGSDSSDLSLFFGRFHPVLVHLPIGFLLMAFLLEFVSLMKRYEQLAHAVPFVLLMGFVSSLFSAITGWLLSDSGGYSEELLALHKWLGLGVVILSFGAWLLRVTLYDDPLYKKIFRVCLSVMVALLMIAGHYGGSLTHGSDYLFRYMPEPVRSWMGMDDTEPEPLALLEDLQTAVVYRDVIEPIFIARCQSCHNPDRAEGNLLMTSYQLVMNGGESGPSVIPNYTDKSDLYQRLRLPDRHQKRMPPRGRTQLTADQIHLIGWWIEEGAPSDYLVTDLERSHEIQSILNRLTVSGQPFFERFQVGRPDYTIIEEAQNRGFRISPVSDGTNFLQVSTLQSKRSITPDDLTVLLKLAEYITWLNLARTDISDKDLVFFDSFKNLTRLHLQNTEITDKSLEFISKLENLEYLNLYSTSITDVGIEKLETLRNLGTLYVWQTDITLKGAESLKSKLPGIYINMGAEISL